MTKTHIVKMREDRQWMLRREKNKKNKNKKEKTKRQKGKKKQKNIGKINKLYTYE